MGMFDCVEISKKFLPRAWHGDQGQTKDFACQMDRYVIDGQGFLYLYRRSGEVGEAEWETKAQFCQTNATIRVRIDDNRNQPREVTLRFAEGRLQDLHNEGGQIVHRGKFGRDW